MAFETWNDLKNIRLEKNIGIEDLAERMRLPVARIDFLEAGQFENEDPIILRLQLKSYAKFLDISYQDVLALSEKLKPEETQLPENNYTSAPKVKKTHAYKGRKKQFNPAFIYGLVVIAAIVVIIVLNRFTNTMQPEYSLYDDNSLSADTLTVPKNEAEDTSSAFKPYIPQSQKEEVIIRDPLEDMAIYRTYTLRTPLNVNIYPRGNMIAHQDFRSGTAREDLILKDRPARYTLERKERIVLYQAENCRLLIDSIDLFTESYSKIAVTVSENDIVTVYVK